MVELSDTNFKTRTINTSNMLRDIEENINDMRQYKIFKNKELQELEKTKSEVKN